MKKVIHIYKTYKPFTQGGIEEYIDSIISHQNSKFEYNLLSIGNINHTSDKVKIFKKSFSFKSDIISLQLFFYLYKKVNKKKSYFASSYSMALHGIIFKYFRL